MENENSHNQDLETEIFSSLRNILNAVEIYSAKLKEQTGLSGSQLSCLLVLNTESPLPLSKLSRKVSLSPSMITTIVDQLEKKELVFRSRQSSDRRVIFIELTEKGKDLVKTAPPSFQARLMHGLRFLREEEKKSLYEGLNRLLSVIHSDISINSALSPTNGKQEPVDGPAPKGGE
jgi:DNA-binding MarR family transcriptional regulator